MEVVIIVGLGIAVLAIGIRMGMLMAPRVERMADRFAREAPPAPATADPPASPATDPPASPATDPPPGTDEGEG